MPRIVCVAGAAPGYGRTSTAVNLSLVLSLAGNHTLLVDWTPGNDACRQLAMAAPQRHPWCGLSSRGDLVSARLSELEVNDGYLRYQLPDEPTSEISVLTGQWTWDELTAISSWDSDMCRQAGTRWAESLEPFDVVVIDCPATAGPVTESALWAANEVLVPMRAEPDALERVPELIRVVRRVLMAPGKQLEFTGVLITQWNATRPLSAPMMQEIRDFFGDIVLETVIPEDEAAAEAPWRMRPVLELAPQSRAAVAYVELGMEVMQR